MNNTTELKAPALIQQRDCIAGTDGTFYQDDRVDSGLTTVVTGYATHYVRVLLCRFGVQCDHFAPGGALEDRNRSFGSNSQCLPNELVFGEASLGVEIDVHVCPETALVYGSSELITELESGPDSEDREGPAISQGTH
jgi:hypothetical protein